LCLLVFLSIPSMVALWRVSGPTIERPRPDMVLYMALHDGAELVEIPAPFRYRPWTPRLAAWVPGPPAAWIDPARPVDAQRAHVHFAVVNVVALALAAGGLARLTRRLLGSERAGFLAALILLTSYVPLTSATLPMVEAWSYAFLVWSLVLLVERRHLALAVVFALGLTCKETTLLVLPAALLLPATGAERRRQLLALLPPTLAYGVWRTLVLPPSETLYSLASTRVWLHDLFVSRERLPGNATRAVLAFHLWWIPALAAWWRRRGDPTAPARWAWIVPPILALPFALALVPDRVWFFAFPFVIPLAVAGLRDGLLGDGVRRALHDPGEHPRQVLADDP
jgi:hypothetical protein